MALIKYKPRTPGTRAMVKIDRSHLHKGGPHLPLTTAQSKTGARNHFGRITTRHVGGGSRQKYRLIDFKRDKDGIAGAVQRVEDDPNRTSHIALIRYADGERRYILAPKGVKSGDVAPLAVGVADERDRKSTRLNSSHLVISYAVFCLKKKKKGVKNMARRPYTPCI